MDDGIYQDQGIIDTSFDFGSGIGCMIPAVIAALTVAAGIKKTAEIISNATNPQVKTCS